jgi:hypothetical protein
MCGGVADFSGHVWHREGEIQHALLQIIDPWLRRTSEDTCNGWKRGPMAPCDDASVGIQPGRQPVGAHRVHVVMPHVVFACELDADGRTKPTGQERRLRAVVGFRLPPKTSAQKGHVDTNLVRRRAEHASDFRLCGLRVLRGCPHLATVATDVCQRNDRLHRHVRQVRHVVFRLHYPCGALQRRFRITHFARDSSRGRHRPREQFAVPLRIVAGIRPVVPRHVERGSSPNRGPGVLRDHGDATPGLECVWRLRRWNFNHLADAGDGQGL